MTVPFHILSFFLLCSFEYERVYMKGYEALSTTTFDAHKGCSKDGQRSIFEGGSIRR
jgi:hypothetical protein